MVFSAIWLQHSTRAAICDMVVRKSLNLCVEIRIFLIVKMYQRSLGTSKKMRVAYVYCVSMCECIMNHTEVAGRLHIGVLSRRDRGPM